MISRAGQEDAYNVQVRRTLIPDSSVRRGPGRKPGSTRLTQYKRKHLISQDRGVQCDTCTHKLPRALIIGVKKGGTGSLLHFLGLHPEIAVINKEIR